MNFVRCPNGHFYLQNETDTCPYCEEEKKAAAPETRPQPEPVRNRTQDIENVHFLIEDPQGNLTYAGNHNLNARITYRTVLKILYVLDYCKVQGPELDRLELQWNGEPVLDLDMPADLHPNSAVLIRMKEIPPFFSVNRSIEDDFVCLYGCPTADETQGVVSKSCLTEFEGYEKTEL